MNLSETRLRKYFGKSLRCLKKLVQVGYWIDLSGGSVGWAFFILHSRFVKYSSNHVFLLNAIWGFYFSVFYFLPLKFNQGWKHYARLTDFSIFLRLTLYMKTTFFELHIHILYREHIIKKKNIKNILSNRKSKTKISKINPSDRLISQKITVQSTLYETIAYAWGTSNNLGFHQHPCPFSCS